MKTTKLSYLVLTVLFIGIAVMGLYLVNMHAGNSDKSFAGDPLSVSVFPVDNGWGYDILEHNKIIIHQNIIPSISGDKPFQSVSDARKTGQLVIKKIRNKQLPIIHKEDLNRLNIHY